jgi:hypothetical protein
LVSWEESGLDDESLGPVVSCEAWGTGELAGSSQHTAAHWVS